MRRMNRSIMPIILTFRLTPRKPVLYVNRTIGMIGMDGGQMGRPSRPSPAGPDAARNGGRA